MQKFNLLSLTFSKFLKNKKYFFAASVLAVVVAGLIFPSGNAHALGLESLGGFILDVIAPLIYLVFYVFFIIAYIVAWIGADMINMTLNPAIINSVLSFKPDMPIYQGWVIFRDVANLLFILILLLIALGTIFRAESYNIKKSLYKFILIIFLINFSGMIAGLFIDFGNFLMYGILKMMCPPVASGTCFQDFFSQVMGVIDILWNKYSIVGIRFDFKDAAAIGIAAIYTFIYGLVLMALGVFLLIRIAALAVLIIISPLAFFGYTAPGLAGLKSKWWDNLVQYVMFGPVFALMLYISGLMANNMIAVDPTIFEKNENLSYMAQDITMILMGIIPLIFLVAIIPVTKAMGIAGANAVLGATVGTGIGAAKWLGGAADRFVSRGASMTGEGKWNKFRRGLSNFSPGAWKRAIKAHTADSEHDYDQASGKLREKYVQRATDWGNKSVIKYGEDNRQKEVYKHKADMKDKTNDEKVSLFKECLDEKGKIKTGMTERAEGIALDLSATSDSNELFTTLKGEDGEFYKNSPDGFSKFMKEKFVPAHGGGEEGEDKTGRLMDAMSLLEKKDKQYSFRGSSKFLEYKNGKKYGKYVLQGEEDREKAAAKEIESLDARNMWQGQDRRSALDQTRIQYENGKIKTKKVFDPKQGKDIEVNDLGWEIGDREAIILAKMTQEGIDFVNRAKPKYLEAMDEAFGALDKDGNNLAVERIKKLPESFISAADKKKAFLNLEKLHKNVKEAIYGQSDKNNQQNGGAGGDQDSYRNWNVDERQNKRWKEEDDEDNDKKSSSSAPFDSGTAKKKEIAREGGRKQRKKRGPQPVSGGSVSKEEFDKKIYNEIVAEAENIKSGKMSLSEKKKAMSDLDSKFMNATGVDSGKEAEKALKAMREANEAFQKEIGQQRAGNSGDVNLDRGNNNRKILEESEKNFEEVFKDIGVYNPTLPNYYKKQSRDLGNFADKLREEKVDSDIIKFVDEAVAKNRSTMANNLRQRDVMEVYYATPKSFGNKDMGKHKEIDFNKYINKIKQGGFDPGSFKKKFDKVDKAIGEIGVSAGTVFGPEYEKAKTFYNFAKESKNSKEQQAYLAMTEHILDSIENGLDDKGIKEILKTDLV